MNVKNYEKESSVSKLSSKFTLLSRNEYKLKSQILTDETQNGEEAKS